MTKKTSSDGKKKTSDVKRTSHAVTAVTHERVTHNPDGILKQRIDLLPSDLIENIKEGLESLMNDFRNVSENNMTDLQRRRKVGAGIKNYGFIEKAAELAEANPKYAQFFNPADLRNCIHNFDKCRDITVILQAFARTMTNTELLYSSLAYTMSLIFYNTQKELSKHGDPAAMELFRALQPFFKKTKRASAEPSEKKT